MNNARIHSGLALATHKEITRHLAIETAHVPDELVLPLNQHGKVALQPCVQPGERVLLGQIIARPDQPLHAALHAPVSGHIKAIETQPSLQGPALCIVISNDHNDTLHPDCQPLPHWSSLDPLQLCHHLALGGIVGLGGAAFSTALKLSTQHMHRIDTLIINGAECEPYITCDDRLMREHAANILRGVQILLHAANATRALIAIEADKPEAIAAVRAALHVINDARVAINVIPSGYPGGDEGQLIARLLRREIPGNGLPADMGVIVQNVATAHACAAWLLHGQPLISRVTTITGHGIAQPANQQVRIGTRITDLLTQCGGATSALSQLVTGGPMMGALVVDASCPVVKATNCIIAASATDFAARPPEQPCIRCGECMHACPVNLMPQLLLVHARQNDAATLHELGVHDCIECGCCDYVCPSHIVLASRFAAAKQVRSGS
jgi:Na+-translocating ferredoxin:NAD+ oxidoreductase subunit C